MAEWIVSLIETHGYAAIALLMMLENVFPPIPSELIMPFAGFAAARGELHPVGVTLAGTLGSLTGTLPWYWAGRSIGAERLRRWADRRGRWLTLSPADLDRAMQWFDRRGGWAVFLGRLVPALRSVISAPAGIASMPLVPFLVWSAAGSMIWSGALCALGVTLHSEYETVAAWLDPVTYVVLGLALAGYAWRLLTRRASPF